jgi:diguanylate cyclase (GGDEF)-like protein
MGRKLFWAGNEKVEIKEISKHLMTTGFSALGEVMRYKGNTLLNNLSIVTVAMREGPIPEKIELDIDEIENKSNMSITARLAIFINTMTEELMEKNDQLNEMLYKASHDALTKLYNRGAIERIIYEGAEECDLIDKNWHLIMFDIDDFKQINDQHGHSEGDNILKTIARTLDEYIKTLDAVEIGRWGGEEFMVYARDYDDEKVKEIADTILLKIRNEAFHVCKVTASVGVTRHRKDEDVLGTINRVDELLYEAKANGKDQFCTDL